MTPLICSKHGTVMRVVPERRQRTVPLRRCPRCTEEFNAAWHKALKCNPYRYKGRR